MYIRIWVPNKDSNLPVHLQSLIRFFIVHMNDFIINFQESYVAEVGFGTSTVR